jgi:hypothetical protein
MTIIAPKKAAQHNSLGEALPAKPSCTALGWIGIQPTALQGRYKDNSSAMTLSDRRDARMFRPFTQR